MSMVMALVIGLWSPFHDGLETCFYCYEKMIQEIETFNRCMIFHTDAMKYTWATSLFFLSYLKVESVISLKIK